MLNIIIDEEYKMTKELGNVGYDEKHLKAPIRKLFDEILDKYKHQGAQSTSASRTYLHFVAGVTKNYPDLYSALGFIKKVQEISILFGRKKYQEALNVLPLSSHENA